ncbi:MAG: type II toxin-antitoxin system PemK/MazF family toxin [Euryarchaeota archaeon]|nr:type II toxin-antitoxin system PemK/MazF family toxin [Euryarchaeota archaeon]
MEKWLSGASRGLSSRLKKIRYSRRFGTTTSTKYSTPYKPGDVILVPFRFTDSDRTKNRPAVIVSVPEYNDSRADAVMVALTARPGRSYFGDCPIRSWKEAGLPKPSTAKGVVRTIEQSLIYHRLGTLTGDDMSRLKQSLRDILAL